MMKVKNYKWLDIHGHAFDRLYEHCSNLQAFVYHGFCWIPSIDAYRLDEDLARKALAACMALVCTIGELTPRLLNEIFPIYKPMKCEQDRMSEFVHTTASLKEYGWDKQIDTDTDRFLLAWPNPRVRAFIQMRWAITEVLAEYRGMTQDFEWSLRQLGRPLGFYQTWHHPITRQLYFVCRSTGVGWYPQEVSKKEVVSLINGNPFNNKKRRILPKKI